MIDDKHRFTIVIPVLNEENNIKELIFLIKKNLKNFKYEIIFIDDNSTDNTKNVIKNYLSRNLRYYLRKKNKDLTLSCFLGIQKSRYKNIIIMIPICSINQNICLKWLIYISKKN